MTPAAKNRKRIEAARALEKRAKRKARPTTAPASIPTKWAALNRQKLLAKDNRAEAHIEEALTKAGMMYVREAPVRHKGREYFMDFAVETCFGIVDIEVDGSQHFTPKGQSKDRARDKAIIESGEAIVVVRLSWSNALSMGADIRALALWACGWPGSTILRY